MTTPKLDLTGTTCIWGQSESGKSYLADQMVVTARKTAEGKKRQFVKIDPQSPMGYDALGVKDALERGDQMIVCNSSKRDHQIGVLVLALNHSTPDSPVYVIADEAPSYMDKGRDSLKRMVLQGRHAGFGVAIIGQRPSSVCAVYRTQAKKTYWGRMTDHTDIGTARDQVGPDNAKNLTSAKQGEFLQWPPSQT